jgi:uncharacterized protein
MTQTQQQTQSPQRLDPITSAPSAAGGFVWHDLMTTDLPRAVEYYTRLLGWTTHVVEIGAGDSYTMIRAGGTDIGGVVRLDPALGIASHWIGYATVDDVDAACERAVALGGAVCVPASDIPDAGRFAVIADPDGAIVSPFRSVRDEAAERATHIVGTFCWNELLTRDPDAVAGFYEGVFGWSYHATDMGPSGTYWLFRRGEADAAGMMRMPADATARPFWMPYVAVDDVDAAAGRAAELGGSIFVAPADIPGVGRFTVTGDPTGATIALFRGTISDE